ncbi:MAG TPA: hypothetical protein VFC56_11545 [Stellaceae bacterium]|nr:hypothetical protein [Stellaceae bacterium]
MLPSPDHLKSRSVMICTPIARAPVWQYTLALAETCVLLQGLGVRFHYTSVVGSSNLPRARNVLAARFLASGATDLMFIDDDVGWDQNDVVRLLACDQPLIAGITRKKLDNPDDVAGWGCQLLSGADRGFVTDASGNIEVARAATGFMRLQRGVFEEMIRARPEWKRGEAAELSPAEQQFYYRFFMYDDEEQTEDYVFCDRWRELGGRVFIDPALRLTHVGVKAYTGAIGELIQAIERRRTFGAGGGLGGSYAIGPISGTKNA